MLYSQKALILEVRTYFHTLNKYFRFTFHNILCTSSLPAGFQPGRPQSTGPGYKINWLIDRFIDTGLSTKNETSETTVQNLNCLFSSIIYFAFCLFVCLSVCIQQTSKREYRLGPNYVWDFTCPLGWFIDDKNLKVCLQQKSFFIKC